MKNIGRYFGRNRYHIGRYYRADISADLSAISVIGRPLTYMILDLHLQLPRDKGNTDLEGHH